MIVATVKANTLTTKRFRSSVRCWPNVIASEEPSGRGCDRRRRIRVRMATEMPRGQFMLGSSATSPPAIVDHCENAGVSPEDGGGPVAGAPLAEAPLADTPLAD